MKTNSKYPMCFVLLISLFIIRANAQSKMSCCSMPSTAQFAMLSNDESFTASHLSPLPFRFIPAKGKMIEFETSDGLKGHAFEVKAARPTENYLIVVHEWWGLNDYIKQEAEKLQGELVTVNVIAVDLYDGKVATNAEDASKYMSEALEIRINAIIDGAINYAGTEAMIQTIGWCFGGGWSLQTAITARQRGRGCVMYYGMPEQDIKRLQLLNAPVLGIFASKDNWITPEIATKFEKDMMDNKKEIMIKIYDADHAFANPSNPNYDKVAAADAHKLAVEFLKKHLE